MIRGKRAGDTHTHAAGINRVQAEELHCRILIAETTSHEEEVCVCKRVVERVVVGRGTSPLKHTHMH